MSSQQLVANELLAFIQHAIDTMDEVSILQICKSNFKEEEISSGKRLLFESLGKLDDMPSRRRDGTAKSIQDIITLLKVTDPDDVPVFVAKELHRLPPVTFDHVDVTRLLKDITSLQTSLAEVKSRLTASENTIGELRAEVLSLRSTVPTCRSPPSAPNVDTRHGAAQNASIGSYESAHMDSSPPAKIADDALRHTADRPAPPVEATSRVSTSTPKRAYAEITASTKAAAQPKQQKGGRKVPCTNKDLPQRSPEKDQGDKDGFILVEKKKRRKPTCRNQCGTAPTGPNHLLRPAVPATLLYVSRLHDSTKVEEIVEFIKIKTNFILKVERLDSRHRVNFNSFVVRVPTEHLSTFTKEEFWPKGVIYRRFRGRLPDTKRHPTPTTCVK